MVLKAFLALGVNSFLIILLSCSHNEKKGKISKIATSQLICSGISCLYKGQLFTGTAFELNEKNDTILKTSYINGKKNGLSIAWYEYGKIKFIYNYKNDVFNGKYEEWYSNGKKYRLLNFENGQEKGLQQVWNFEGKIKINYQVIDNRKYGLTGTNICKNVSEK